MLRYIFKIICILVTIIFLLGTAVACIYLTVNWTLSNATKYCPLSHKFDADKSCQIICKMDNKLLIRHFDLDDHSLLLSIYKNKKMIWLINPENNSKVWDEKLLNSKITFDPASEDSIIINNFKVPIIIQ